MDQIIKSMLDTDQYKISMMNVVCRLYPHAVAKYKFVNRGKTPFPPGFASALREQINALASITLTTDEKDFLLNQCTFLDPVFIDFIAGFRSNPEKEIFISQSDEDLSIEIVGPWYKTILYEVPVMAIVSELYYILTKNIPMTESHILSPLENEQRAREKGKKLAENGCYTAEFGTRRRFSKKIQETSILGLKLGAGEHLVGTSNLMFAMQHRLKSIGTMAHEVPSAVAILRGMRHANLYAMEDWVSIYQGNLGIALPDTFGSDAFFQDFNAKYAKLFDGVRHDSNDSMVFGERVIRHYESLNIDPLSKTIVFSDGLDVNEAIRIQKHFAGRIKTSFGIGTAITNDCGARPLNIVIKLFEINGTPAVKLSDTPGKETGDPKAIEYAKWVFGR